MQIVLGSSYRAPPDTTIPASHPSLEGRIMGMHMYVARAENSIMLRHFSSSAEATLQVTGRAPSMVRRNEERL